MKLTPWNAPRNGRTYRSLRILALGAWLLCLALWPLAQACAQGARDHLRGPLKQGPAYSTLWEYSKELGGWVAFVFKNDSEAGQRILQNCLPGADCAVVDVTLTAAPLNLATDPPQDGVMSMAFGIRSIQDAYFAGSERAFSETSLQTRFGLLHIDDEGKLFLDDQPVMAPLGVLAPPGALAHTYAESSEFQAAPEAVSPWRRYLRNVRRQLLLATWRSHATGSAYSSSLEQIQGGPYVRMVDGRQMGAVDIIVLQNGGASACPAMFYVLTTSKNGAVSTPEFGTCSEMVHIDWGEDPADPGPFFFISGIGVMDSNVEEQLHKFAFRKGAIHATIGPH